MERTFDFDNVERFLKGELPLQHFAVSRLRTDRALVITTLLMCDNGRRFTTTRGGLVFAPRIDRVIATVMPAASTQSTISCMRERSLYLIGGEVNPPQELKTLVEKYGTDPEGGIELFYGSDSCSKTS